MSSKPPNPNLLVVIITTIEYAVVCVNNMHFSQFYEVEANAIKCLICCNYIPFIAGVPKFANDTFMNHLVMHSNASASYHDGGLTIFCDIPKKCDYGILYFARLFPVIALVRFVNKDLELSKLAKLYKSYPMHESYSRSSMLNIASEKYSDVRVDKDYVIECRRMIAGFDYICGKCGMEYERGIPTMEIAWGHFVKYHVASQLGCGVRVFDSH